MTIKNSEKLKIQKERLVEYLFVLSVVFADILGNGNLNLLYFFGVLLMFKNLKIQVSFLKDMVIFFVPFCLMILGEIFFSGNTFSLVKVLVYSLKILVCISLLSYTKKRFWAVDHLAIIKKICGLFEIMLVISLLTINRPIFWRLNDVINRFSKTRLKFLYSEPSVLGILCGLLVIILLYYVFDNKKNYMLSKEIIILAVIILLTFSMSGIVYTAVGILVLFLFQVFKNKECIPRRMLMYFLFGICLLIIILSTNNPISNRFFSMFLGTDGSYNFRWSAAVNVFRKTMEITDYWGMGLGNMNTPSGLSFLLSIGIDYKFANSFLYFFTENGMLGIIYTIYLFLICIYNCIKSSKNIRPLKVGVLAFAFVSQIAGGYYTDPILWIVYGIVCSNEKTVIN